MCPLFTEEIRCVVYGGGGGPVRCNHCNLIATNFQPNEQQWSRERKMQKWREMYIVLRSNRILQVIPGPWIRSFYYFFLFFFLLFMILFNGNQLAVTRAHDEQSKSYARSTRSIAIVSQSKALKWALGIFRLLTCFSNDLDGSEMHKLIHYSVVVKPRKMWLQIRCLRFSCPSSADMCHWPRFFPNVFGKLSSFRLLFLFFCFSFE